jgi:putative ABC transport system ATP-binding protein
MKESSYNEKNKLEVLNVLKEFNEQGKTVVVVTHDDEVANYCTRTIRL